MRIEQLKTMEAENKTLTNQIAIMESSLNKPDKTEDFQDQIVGYRQFIKKANKDLLQVESDLNK